MNYLFHKISGIPNHKQILTKERELSWSFIEDLISHLDLFLTSVWQDLPPNDIAQAPKNN